MRGAVAIAALLVAGCAQDRAAAPPIGAAAGVKCDANPAQRLVGRRADTVAAEAQRLSGARTVRRYRAGSPVTMDFRADRLNIETDAAGQIVKLSCG